MNDQNSDKSSPDDEIHAAKADEDTDPKSKAGETSDKSEPEQEEPADAPGNARRYVLFGGFLVLPLLIGGGTFYWLSTRNLESTDDAYTDGRAITIAPQVSGTVVSLDVTDNEFVHKGQELIHIDPRGPLARQTERRAPTDHLGSGLIDYNQKRTAAAMPMADMKVCAHRS